MDAFFDTLRWVNIGFALWTTVRLIQLRARNWKTVYSDQEQVLWFALFGAVITGGIASLENVLQNNQGGPRVFCTFIYLAFTLWGSYIPRVSLHQRIK